MSVDDVVRSLLRVDVACAAPFDQEPDSQWNPYDFWPGLMGGGVCRGDSTLSRLANTKKSNNNK